MANKPPTENNRIYIDELAKLPEVNRQVNTIRRWHNDGRLPKHLYPKRGARRRRYWTHAQVYGPRGIIAWMKKNDMRPGNLIADPDKESEHVAHLRKPKYLTGHHINSVRHFVEKGWTRERIIKKIFPRTRYARPENLEAALVKYFAAQGWEFPPAAPKKKVKLSKKTEAEIKRLEKRLEQLGG